MLATSRTSVNQSVNKSRVHSAGCVRDGKAICACDHPAARYISKTEANPGRPFYRCADNKCSFWKWESDLFGAGLIPPPPPAPPKTPQRQTRLTNTVTPPTTPRNSASQLPLSPPRSQPPAKRNYARMSTGSRPGLGSSQQRARDISPGARDRRLATIQAALEGLSSETGTGTNTSASATGVQADAPDSDDEHERGNFYHESSSSEDEYSAPATKRTRFAVKTEEEEPLVSQAHSTPPHRPSACFSKALPTPSQTSERESAAEIEDFFNSTGPASPTSFTRGAQRALERARGHVDAAGPGSNKGKSRAPGFKGDDNDNGGEKTREAHDPIPALSTGEDAERHGGECQHEHESFQTQLASTIERSGSHVRTPASCVHNGNLASSSKTHSSAATAMLNALSSMATQQATVQTALHDLLAESERLRRKMTAAEKSAACKERHIAKLQEEIAELKTRNAELESFRDQIQSFTQSTPPRK